MAKREWTMNQVTYFIQLLKVESSDRKVARIIGCRRSLVKNLRGLSGNELEQKLKLRSAHTAPSPDWSMIVNWSEVQSLITKGFELKRIWEESAQEQTTYSNFWKYVQKHFAHLLKGTITLREFSPGSQCEVDWAGDKIPWFNAKGEKQEAHVFIGVLCFSQLLFAYVTRDEKQGSFISAHEKFFRFLGGTPAVTVSDNLKTGVKTPDRYDADLNPVYQDFASHYNTAVVPARVYKPKDKSLAEGGVKIVLRYFRWTNRNKRFTSLSQINEALRAVCTKINERKHTRFRVSRMSRYLELEKSVLRPLPETLFELIEWKTATLHQDNTVDVDAAYYSAPHQLRGRKLRIKLSQNTIEIFSDLARVAVHTRDRARCGNRVIEPSHLQANSRAYLETTPQSLLSQARFIGPELHQLVDALFNADTLAHMRRVQGFVRYARSEIETYGRTKAEVRIASAVAHMNRFNQIRVKVFRETIERLRKANLLSANQIDREIVRIPGNPMLRQTESIPVQEPLAGILIPFPERAEKRKEEDDT